MKDWLGIEIKVGSHVVYPARHGSRLWMVLGRVEELHEQESGVTLTRLKQSSRHGTKDQEPKKVRVGINRLTLVRTAEEIELDSHPLRYVTAMEMEPAPYITEVHPNAVWTLANDIEIDGRAS